MPDNRHHQGTEEVRWVFPVYIFGDQPNIGEQLVEHAAVIQKDKVEQQAQRCSADDNGEKVNRAEELRPEFDLVYQKRKNERKPYLNYHGECH